jgi:hypothetical protein
MPGIAGRPDVQKHYFYASQVDVIALCLTLRSSCKDSELGLLLVAHSVGRDVGSNATLVSFAYKTSQHKRYVRSICQHCLGAGVAHGHQM